MITVEAPPSPLLIRVAPTPNPNARKFILDRPVLAQGKASFSSLDQPPEDVRLAWDLLALEGVKQVHFFENVITVTIHFDLDFQDFQESLLAIIQTRMPIHDPHFNFKSNQIKKRNLEELPEEIRQIEEILDRTIRPGLQGDGGDIEVIKYENNELYVRYQGACGTCPSATTGTLMAIESILRDETGQSIQVIPV
jgi:NFU1 iron-sulfur cluster scaffold homolog, mitochondrial